MTYNYLPVQTDQSTVTVVPTTGFSTTMPNNCSTYIMNPAGTLATGTLIMPANPLQGQLVRILSTQSISTFTLSASPGQTIAGNPSTLVANSGIQFIYSGTAWLSTLPTTSAGSSGTFATRTQTAAGNVSLSGTDCILLVNKTVGQATGVTLPTTPANGMMIIIKDGKGDAGTNNITISPASGSIDNSSTLTMATNWQSVKLIYTGAAWSVMSVWSPSGPSAPGTPTESFATSSSGSFSWTPSV